MVTDALIADDERLLGADPALPGLTVLLDDDALTQFLQQRNPTVRCARATYLRYKPGTTMVAAVLVTTADGDHLALAQATSRPGRPKLDKIARAAKTRHTWCYLDDVLLLAVAGAGADRHLRGLHRELRRPGMTTVRYKPARRWVGRRSLDGAAELTKVFDGDQAAFTAAAVRALADAGVPGPLLRRERLHRATLSFAWTKGITLDRLPDPDLYGAGALLARLHQVPWPMPQNQGRSWWHEFSTAGRGLQDLARVAPGLQEPAARAEQIVQGLGALLPAAQAPLVTSHGDLSADQMLVEPGGALRLLDLDSLLRAPRAFDLGEWIGEYLARTCPTGANAATAAEFLDPALAAQVPLLAGYTDSSTTRIELAQVLAMAAIAVLSRATEPFRWRQDRWIEAARSRVEVAALLAQRAHDAAKQGRHLHSNSREQS